MERGQVDLRQCKHGDILISALGAKLKYIKPLSDEDYMEHEVEYLTDKDGKPFINMGKGSRTHDGYVFRKKRNPEIDHDIVQIIKQN